MSNTEFIKTYVAKTDLKAKVGYAVVGTTDAKVKNTAVVALAGANAKARGIIVDGGLGANTGACIQIGGFVKAILGTGGATAFAPLKVDAGGALVVATEATDVVIAFANEAGTAGKLIEVEVVSPRAFI